MHYGFIVNPSVTTLTIKGLPRHLHARLKTLATEHGRSLNRQVIDCLGAAVEATRVDPDTLIEQARALRTQIGRRVPNRQVDQLKRRGRA